MQIIENNKVKEKMYKEKLDNGLDIMIIPKKGVQKKYIIWGINFGSVDNKFILGDSKEVTKIPDGIAHYLEHKMFEQRNGVNSLDALCALGVDANAFTTNNFTAYLYECTDKFYEALDEFMDYVQNPYYTTISDFLSNGNILDPILEKSGYWADTIVPYGPLWTSICGLFSFISLGNLTFLLYIYKIASLGIHIATCYIVYKLTNKKKFALMYGLNPFLLLEFLTNVHNDLYLVFFVLLGIYFLKNKNNIWASLACLTCSILIKYITVVLAPFLVLYYLKDKTKLKKILWCILYAAVVITVILGIYMLFFNSIRRFTFNIRNTTRKNKGLNLSNNVSFRIK